MKYSFFPGCTMSGTAVEYRKSLGLVNKIIGLELLEIPDWNCCGATAGHSTSNELGIALPARNIALCEREGLNLPIAVACAACYSRLCHASYQLRSSNEQREKYERLIEMPIKGTLDVISILDVYQSSEVRTAIGQAVKKPLKGLRVACYYGCLYVRPSRVTGADKIENPVQMDEIIRLAGCDPVQWSYKTECCGGSHHIDLPKHSRPLVRRILQNARASGAQAIASACPLCMMNLDMRQRQVNRDYNEDFDIPIFFFTELLALSMGADVKSAGVSTHFHPAAKLANNALAGRVG